MSVRVEWIPAADAYVSYGPVADPYGAEEVALEVAYSDSTAIYGPPEEILNLLSKMVAAVSGQEGFPHLDLVVR